MSTDAATQAFINADDQANDVEGDLQTFDQQSAVTSVAALTNWLAADGVVRDDDLSVVSAALGISDTAGEAAQQQALSAGLTGLSGSAFDQAYLTTNIAEQTADLVAQQAYIAGGTQTSVVQLAKAEVPILEDHIHELQIVDHAYFGGPAATVPFPTDYTAAPPSAATGAANAGDQAFIDAAINDALISEAEGELALGHANPPSTGILGAWTVENGGQLRADIASLAASAGATVPGAVDAAGAAQIATLRGLTGTAFDIQFASDQIANDQAAIRAAAAEVYSGADPALVARAGTEHYGRGTSDGLLSLAVSTTPRSRAA